MHKEWLMHEEQRGTACHSMQTEDHLSWRDGDIGAIPTTQVQVKVGFPHIWIGHLVTGAERRVT